MNINKVLNRDKERVVQQALRVKFADNDGYPYVIELDSDKGEVYFEMWTEQTGYTNWMVKVSFNADFTLAKIESEPVQVVTQTEYKPVSEDGIVAKVLKGLVEHFGGTNRTAPSVETVPVIKQFQEEQMIAVEPLYIEPDGVDGHGWTASADVLRSMTESCDKAIREGRLLAKYNHKTLTDDFVFLKAFVNEVDCYIGDTFVPEGQPMIKSQFKNKDAWEKRKSGEICGVSIGAKGHWEKIEE